MLDQKELNSFYTACEDGNLELIQFFLDQKDIKENLLDYEDFHVWKQACISDSRIDILKYLIETSTESDRKRAFVDHLHSWLNTACSFGHKGIFDTLVAAIPSSQLPSVLQHQNHQLLQTVCQKGHDKILDTLLQKYPNQSTIDEGLQALDVNEASHLGHDKILALLKKHDINKRLNTVDCQAPLFLKIIKEQPHSSFFKTKQREPEHQPEETKKRIFGLF